MTDLVEAVLAGADADQLRAAALPTEYRAAHLRKEDIGVFGKAEERDVRCSIRVGTVPMPEIADDEVLIAVMASSINFNTVWSATFRPVPTFTYLSRLGRQGWWGARHNLRQHVIGSDAAGVVVRTGPGVRHWSVGDRIVVNPVYVDEQLPATFQDSMMSEALAWGYETNFGGLGEFAVVKAHQLLPKPAHLSWEEAACNTVCAATAYRMLVSPLGARMKQGDIVLIWGAAGGLGGYAAQLVRNGGGIGVGVVSSAAKAEAAQRAGCAAVIDRSQLGLAPEGFADMKACRRLAQEIRGLVGEDPHIVFEHTGRETFGASVFVARKGGTVVTCGSSSGYQHEFDNRYLWTQLKRVIGSHAANAAECWEINRLIGLGLIAPTLSTVYSLDETAEATRAVQLNQHVGKVGVRCLAPAEGLGIEDHVLRGRLGEEGIRPFRAA
jgi:crotonyl-CoA reductase